jgi:hypothetical protein
MANTCAVASATCGSGLCQAADHDGGFVPTMPHEWYTCGFLLRAADDEGDPWSLMWMADHSQGQGYAKPGDGCD